jgi:serine protease Do
MTRSVARIRFGAAVAVAFVCGLVFASGFDLTRFGYAQQSRVGAEPVINESKSTLADVGNSFADIAQRVTPAVVSIQAERDARTSTRVPRGQRRNGPPGIEDFMQQLDPRQMQLQPAEASGTGFIVSKDGYILTNNHVVESFDRLNVTLTDHRVFKAKVIGRDPTTDVAVIKIDGKDLPTATLGNDETTRIGEWVVAIGNPLGLDFTVTAGIVSAKGRSANELRGLNRDQSSISDFIQTDAAINPGNSGGPLVNIRGDVIGINSAIASGTGYYSGYGFAIPITLAKQVMDDITEHGRVRRAALGVFIQEVRAADAGVAGMNKIMGAIVEGFPDGDSPAKSAGLEIGDIVIGIDGKQADRVSTLQRYVRTHTPGDVVALDVMRYGDKKTFKVKLTEARTETTVAENGDDPKDSAKEGVSYDKLGITVEPVSAEIARAMRLNEDRRGLRVVDVSSSGPAHNQLFQNDVILEVMYPTPRKAVRSVADFQSALGKLKSGEYVSLLVLTPPQPGQSGLTRVVNLRVGT